METNNQQVKIELLYSANRHWKLSFAKSAPKKQAQQGKGIEKGTLEGVAAGEVDEEVDGGVEHERQVVEAGEAQDPGWGWTSLAGILVIVSTAWKVFFYFFAPSKFVDSILLYLSLPRTTQL